MHIYPLHPTGAAQGMTGEETPLLPCN